MKAFLIECTDHKKVYGYLTVLNISTEEVQNKIYEIKAQFEKEGIDDWMIVDVLQRFPEDWSWNYKPSPNEKVEI